MIRSAGRQQKTTVSGSWWAGLSILQAETHQVFHTLKPNFPPCMHCATWTCPQASRKHIHARPLSAEPDPAWTALTESPRSQEESSPSKSLTRTCYKCKTRATSMSSLMYGRCMELCYNVSDGGLPSQGLSAQTGNRSSLEPQIQDLPQDQGCLEIRMVRLGMPLDIIFYCHLCCCALKVSLCHALLKKFPQIWKCRTICMVSE